MRFNPSYIELKYEHLLGRTFIAGSQDCYSIVRDFYRDNFNILLRDYARPNNWIDLGFNLYYDNFHREGFELVDARMDQLREGDLILMAFNSIYPSHASIYVGNGKLVHHLQSRLSSCDSFRGPFRNAMTGILRHKQITIEEPKGLDYDISNLLTRNL